MVNSRGYSVDRKSRGRRARKRQRLKYMDSLRTRCKDNMSPTQLTRATENSVLWQHNVRCDIVFHSSDSRWREAENDLTHPPVVNSWLRHWKCRRLMVPRVYNTTTLRRRSSKTKRKDRFEPLDIENIKALSRL